MCSNGAPQTSLVSYCIIKSESVIGCLLCTLIICMSKHSQVMCCAAVGLRHHCYTDHDMGHHCYTDHDMGHHCYTDHDMGHHCYADHDTVEINKES